MNVQITYGYFVKLFSMRNFHLNVMTFIIIGFFGAGFLGLAGVVIYAIYKGVM